jgi:hypothetical protein
VLISASRTLALPPAAVFAFLADGRNHHKLTGRGVRLLEIRENGESGLRGVLIIRGPFGIRRIARTRIESFLEPTYIAGVARVGSATTAGVRWDLRGSGDGSTRVVLSATVRSSGGVDRLLLSIGGAIWLRRLFAATLELLAAHMADLVDTSRWQSVPGDDSHEPRLASA